MDNIAGRYGNDKVGEELEEKLDLFVGNFLSVKSSYIEREYFSNESSM